MSAVIVAPMTPETLSLHDLAARVNTEHAIMVEEMQSVIRRARRIGADLLAAKAQLDQHGHWLPWLRHNCPKISPRRAQLYMQVAAHVQVHPAFVARFDLFSLREMLTEMRKGKSAPVSHLPQAPESASAAITASRDQIPESTKAKRSEFERLVNKAINDAKAILQDQREDEVQARLDEKIEHLSTVEGVIAFLRRRFTAAQLREIADGLCPRRKSAAHKSGLPRSTRRPTLRR